MRDICGGNVAHTVLPSELGRACFQCHPLPLTASTAVEIRRSRELGFQQWLPVGLSLLILLPPSPTIRSSWTQLGSSNQTQILSPFPFLRCRCLGFAVTLKKLYTVERFIGDRTGNPRSKLPNNELSTTDC